MSDKTKIQWTQHTGGPYLGCSIVSPGCIHCYAKELAEARLWPIFRKAYKAAGFADWETRPIWGDKATRVLSKGFWNDARRINAQHAKAGTHGRWFPSMIDWLDETPAGIIDQDGNKLDPIAVLADFLKLIHDTPNLTWILLTKRPENWRSRLEAVLQLEDEHSKCDGDAEFFEWLNGWVEDFPDRISPPLNVWILTSVENQEMAYKRIPELLKIPAVVRGLSVEPMLEGLRFRTPADFIDQNGQCGVHWVIYGGESGKGARPCNVEWIRDGVKQCKAAGVNCFVKQGGSNFVDSEGNKIRTLDPKGGDLMELPEDIRVREFPN